MPAALNITNILLQDLRGRVLRDLAYRAETMSQIAKAVPILDHMPDLTFLFAYWTINWFQLFEHFAQIHFAPVIYDYSKDLNAQDSTLESDNEQNATIRFYEIQGGFIPKFAAHFESIGWTVDKAVTPSRTEADNQDHTEVDVKLTAWQGGNKQNWNEPHITVQFFGIDPDKLEKSNPTCRVEYERVEVPAKVVYKAKVVCDDPAEQQQLAEGQPALEEA